MSKIHPVILSLRNEQPCFSPFFAMSLPFLVKASDTMLPSIPYYYITKHTILPHFALACHAMPSAQHPSIGTGLLSAPPPLSYIGGGRHTYFSRKQLESHKLRCDQSTAFYRCVIFFLATFILARDGDVKVFYF